MCVVALVTWLSNPFAAALLIPAMHLWMWVVDPEVRLRASVTLALLLAGLAAPALLIVYYALLARSRPGRRWPGTACC